MSTAYRIVPEQQMSWQRPVLEITATPPVGPAKGDRYIVGDSATGAWSGHDNDIAVYSGTGWLFDTPAEGWNVYNKDDELEYRFTSGGTWENDDISGKADKVSGATNGNLAGLDTNGNLTDSGLAASDVSTGVSHAETAYDARGQWDADFGCIIMNL